MYHNAIPHTNATFITQAATTVNQDDAKKRDHLASRIWSIYSKHVDTLREKFNMNDDIRPWNAKELVERIKEGKFILDKKFDKLDEDELDEYFDGPFDGIYWRDPDKVKDVDGFRAAMAELDIAYKHVQDDIAILSPEKALESVRAFEDWTYSA